MIFSFGLLSKHVWILWFLSKILGFTPGVSNSRIQQSHYFQEERHSNSKVICVWFSPFIRLICNTADWMLFFSLQNEYTYLRWIYKVSKVGNFSRGRPEGSLFNSCYWCWGRHNTFPWITPLYHWSVHYNAEY